MHTPASADWQEPDVTYLQWLQKAESRGLDIVAITDHNTVEGIARLRAEIERLTWLEANDRLRPQERRDLDEYRRLGDKILVLPGFEFTATFGFHILAVFPPETPLRKLELLLLRLNVPDDRLSEGSTEVGPTTDVISAYRVIHEAGGIVIAAHANSTHGVALQGLSFGGQTKIAFTQDSHLHALEVTDLESTSRRATARFFDGSKPEYPRRMHCIQGSDAHRLSRDPKDKNRLGIGERVTEFLLPDVSFEALRAVFAGDDFTRTRPYRPPAETPFDHVEAAREQGNNIVQAFHESVTREGGRLHKLLCDVVAFANTSGGTIYVGAGAVRRVPPKGVENPESLGSMLRRETERSVTPPLDVRVDTIQSLGVPILRVIVPQGEDKPYALNQTRVYVRQEGETNEAVRDELVQLVLGGQQVAVVVPEPTTPTVEIAAVIPSPVAPDVVAPPEPSIVVPEQPGVTGEAIVPIGLQPSVGVEIVAMEERKGGRYFAIRDLRNGNVIQNVTMQSARKLWSYAISQHLTNPVDPARVTWQDDFGLWQAARRAKKLRYDLVSRLGDGSLRVFYGVTADGMTGPWAHFLQAEDRGEGEPKLASAVVPERIPESVEGADVASVPGGERDVPTSEIADGKALLAAEAAGETKRRTRRPRSKRKPESPSSAAVDGQVAGALDPSSQPAPTSVAETVTASSAAAPAADVPPKVSPRPRPRSRRSAKSHPAAAPVAGSEPAPETQKAHTGPLPSAEHETAPKPKPRARSRKPKTSPEGTAE